jgi:hypothetical protein
MAGVKKIGGIWRRKEYEERGRRERERGMEKEDGLARREAGRKAMLMSGGGGGGGVCESVARHSHTTLRFKDRFSPRLK